MARILKRREFFKRSVRAGLSLAVGETVVSRSSRSPRAAWAAELPTIAVVSGGNHLQSVSKAVEILGGITAFVPKGSRVALLPNVQSRHPGTFTSPGIFRGVIQLCKKAGVKEINCPSLQALKNWEDTGLYQVVREEGVNLRLVEKDEALFKTVAVPGGRALMEARVMNELYNNDIFINLPITKDHAGNKFTGAMKNLMGLNSPLSNRTFHRQNWRTDPNDLEHLDQSIVDLNKVIRPALNIVDATEIITTNGPFGPGELARPQKVVAGIDRVAVDAYCSTLWGNRPEDIIMIRLGSEQGLGEMNLAKVRIKEEEA